MCLDCLTHALTFLPVPAFTRALSAVRASRKGERGGGGESGEVEREDERGGEEEEMVEEDENERLARFTSVTASVIAALAARPTKVPTSKNVRILFVY